MRFESKGLAFHQALRAAFLDIAAGEPERCAVIDADQPVEAVETAIRAVVRERLGVDV
jgi:dTMP kinase